MIAQMYSFAFWRKKQFPIIICYLIVFFLSACKDGNSRKPLNIKDVKLNFKKIRFDQEIYSLDTNQLEYSLDKLGKKYPDLTNIYFQRLAGIGTPKDTGFYSRLNHFLTYKDYRQLYDSVQFYFPNTEKADQSLISLFKHIKYFYPEEKLGEVVYFISGLNKWSAITIDSTVGVGLDMFLGEDFPFYKASALGIADYQLRTHTADYIPIKTAKNLFENKWAYEPEGKTLLDLMLYRGKQLYFMENVLRDESDARLISFSKEQLEWCEKNEAMIYYFFIKRNILYSTQWQEILPYVNDGPRTAGMPEESPGNIGTWLGWKIVREYMNEHTELSLQELMAMPIDGQKFLFESRFKPE